jgi:hypothetical protein
VCALHDGDLDEGKMLASDAMERFRQVGDGWAAAGCLDYLAQIATRRNDLQAALRLAEESVSAYRSCGGLTGIQDSLLNLAGAARLAGDAAMAERSARESLELSLEHGYRWGAMEAHRMLAALATDSNAMTHHTRQSEELARQLRNEGVYVANTAAVVKPR